jgi:hypothetical protein
MADTSKPFSQGNKIAKEGYDPLEENLVASSESKTSPLRQSTMIQYRTSLETTKQGNLVSKTILMSK